MLVFSRKCGQKIILVTGAGERIVVEPVANNYGKMRIGITAPRSVTIDREEIFDMKQAGVAATVWGAVPLPSQPPG